MSTIPGLTFEATEAVSPLDAEPGVEGVIGDWSCAFDSELCRSLTKWARLKPIPTPAAVATTATSTATAATRLQIDGAGGAGGGPHCGGAPVVASTGGSKVSSSGIGRDSPCSY